MAGKPILPKSNIGEMKAVKREAEDGYRESKTHYFWIKAINEVRSGARYKPIKLCLWPCSEDTFSRGARQLIKIKFNLITYSFP